ncbi:MAG: dependent oxidoreductase, partial [Geobacteraceae bacterium]|nr:dependent oxidoreductase [Geobacteraceae bacterium]
EYSPDDFVPRGVYRRYITACLDREMGQRPPGALTVLQDEVRAVVPEGVSHGYHLRLKSGGTIRARAVVLAIGNLPPRSSLDNGLLCSPWCRSVDYRSIETLAIVGAGLTALDVILDAEASGFSGRYWVISPHGQFPRSHREPFVPVPAELREWAAELAATRPKLRRALRTFQQVRKSGVHWEPLVDSLRMHAPGMWSSFEPAEKQRFLRHLRTFWNTHLHRSCQRSIQVVMRLMDTGRLEQIHARVTAVEKREGSCDSAVRLVLQSDTVRTIDVDAAVNGTGLFSNIRKTGSALVAQLLDDGLVEPDAFCLGLRVTGAGQLLSVDGTVRSDLFTVGTLRRGEELECTAVPEIRRQVAVMVEEIVRMEG